MSRWLPLLVAVLVFPMGWGAATLLGGEDLTILDECGVPLVERVSYSTDWTLWPPGATRCEWAGPAGSGSGLYLPWAEWAIALLSAIGAGLIVSAVLPGRRLRLIRVALGVVLPLGALAAWFIGAI